MHCGQQLLHRLMRDASIGGRRPAGLRFAPLGPLTRTCRPLTSMVSPSGISTARLLASSFMAKRVLRELHLVRDHLLKVQQA